MSEMHMEYMPGDRVKVIKGDEHGEGMGGAGTVREVATNALGIELDSMPGEIHHWYVAIELEPEEPQAGMASSDRRCDMSDTRPLEIRGIRQGYELRNSEDGGMPTMFGHFAVVNRWTEINSWSEGNFLERLRPGFLRKTLQENRSRIRALFQHGQDPQIGDKPLGPIEELHEDETGGYYEVPLLDTAYNRELIPGLEAGLYGASFRFEVLRDERDEAPGVSEHNPSGIPERSIKEIRLHEFGPVTFPAYAEATSGVRSLTDWFLFEQIARDPQRARELVSLRAADFTEAPAQPDAGTPTSGDARREWPKVTNEEWESLWSPKI